MLQGPHLHVKLTHLDSRVVPEHRENSATIRIQMLSVRVLLIGSD